MIRASLRCAKWCARQLHYGMRLTPHPCADVSFWCLRHHALAFGGGRRGAPTGSRTSLLVVGGGNGGAVCVGGLVGLARPDHVLPIVVVHGDGGPTAHAAPHEARHHDDQQRQQLCEHAQGIPELVLVIALGGVPHRVDHEAGFGRQQQTRDEQARGGRTGTTAAEKEDAEEVEHREHSAIADSGSLAQLVAAVCTVLVGPVLKHGTSCKGRRSAGRDDGGQQLEQAVAGPDELLGAAVFLLSTKG
mmetsp:Transcript_3253/g.9421  ORF Transcript_3253/g.9421 Transcript_3253/m.9421 type:complete len:246 (-) Transcript_3253:567-1304(-)